MAIVRELEDEDWTVEAWDTAAFQPRYNVAPTQQVPILLRDGPRVVRDMRWGLVPHWAKDRSIGNKMINARAETLTEKPAFRGLVGRKRCVVLTDGFYEWKRDEGSKVPHYIHDPDGRLLPMAGLWSRWDKGEEGPLCSFTIITTTPSSDVSSIHHRMPVILRPESIPTWIEFEDHPKEEALGLLGPYEGPLEAYPVSTYVNSPRNDGPTCVEPASPSHAPA